MQKETKKDSIVSDKFWVYSIMWQNKRSIQKYMQSVNLAEYTHKAKKETIAMKYV